MDINLLRQQLEALSATAGMNQRYHQLEASQHEKQNEKEKLLTGIAGVLSLVFSITSFFSDHWTIIYVALLLSVGTAFLAVWLNISKADDRQKLSLDLFRRWTDLRQDIDVTLSRAKRETNTNEEISFLYLRYEELQSKKNSLNGLEPSPNTKLLIKCQEDENLSRYGYRTQDELNAAYEKKKRSMVAATG